MLRNYEIRKYFVTNRNLPHAFEIDIARFDDHDHDHEFSDDCQVAWNESYIPQYLAGEETVQDITVRNAEVEMKRSFTPKENFSSFLYFCTETLKLFEDYCLLDVIPCNLIERNKLLE
jgi:hypothetical protein